MKRLKNMRKWIFFVVVGLLAGCDAEGLKGTLKIAITDSPVDAKNVRDVNIVITNIEGMQDGTWKSFRNFEQPIGVNLLDYIGDRSVLLIDQFSNPGEYSSIRIKLNMASRNSSLIVNPQSNIVFSDGSSTPLYMPEGTAHEIILDYKLGISSRGITNLTLDFDARKSIRKNENGEFILSPVIRIVDTNNAGHIRISTTKKTPPAQVAVHAYKKGSFDQTETVSQDGITFRNTVTSNAIKSEKTTLGFLEAGVYDLIFVKYNELGEVLEVLGRESEVEVNKGETVDVIVDLNQLGPV
ncbi:MAG: DUF4382 domain-containing protein [Cyclobacteriaceae bacterium]